MQEENQFLLKSPWLKKLDFDLKSINLPALLLTNAQRCSFVLCFPEATAACFPPYIYFSFYLFMRFSDPQTANAYVPSNSWKLFRTRMCARMQHLSSLAGWRVCKSTPPLTPDARNMRGVFLLLSHDVSHPNVFKWAPRFRRRQRWQED